MRSNFDREVAGHGITRSQWTMVTVVARHSGATQRVIAEALEMSEASAGRLIDRLCVDGLLERRSRDGDRRARAVYITPKAEPLLAKLNDIAAAAEQRIFAGMTDDQLEQLRSSLEQIYANSSRS